jgi:alpha-ketoglutarate-dependent taurine dioxygenase
MFYVVTAVAVALGALAAACVYWYREAWRRQADMDGVVLRYLGVAQTHEALIRELTEPHGGVLSSLEDTALIRASLAQAAQDERFAAARLALARVECQLRLILRQVAGRYQLTEADRQRWLSDDEECHG